MPVCDTSADECVETHFHCETCLYGIGSDSGCTRPRLCVCVFMCVANQKAEVLTD